MDGDLSIGAAAAQEPQPEEFDFQSPDPVGPESHSSLWERVLTAETGPGDLSEYQEHVLNFTQDQPGSRIARGLTGLFDGALNLAIIDILIGVGQLVFSAYKRRQIPAA